MENGVHDTVAVALADFENEAYIVLEFSHLTRPNLQEQLIQNFNFLAREEVPANGILNFSCQS